MDIQKKALEIALTQEGVSEDPKGSNWGPKIKEYLAAAGLKASAPWCMSFVVWCFDQAAKELNVKNPLYKTGGVLYGWQQRSATLGIKTNPQPGDVFIMRFAHGTGHTGIVESVDETHVHTIEGNTNDDGSREGYEVARRSRLKTSIMAYLRADKAV
jgi:hypothetical protein